MKKFCWIAASFPHHFGFATMETIMRLRTSSGRKDCRGRGRGAEITVAPLLVLLWIVFSVDFLVSGAPYRLLTSSSAKCFHIDPPRDTTLAIRYHAPGAFFKVCVRVCVCVCVCVCGATLNVKQRPEAACGNRC